MNLSLSNFNLPFVLSSYCVFPADAMMRHLLACPLLIFFFLFSKTLLSLRCAVTPNGGEPGIWLPLTLNKQLLSDSHDSTVVLRDRHPRGNHPGDRRGLGGWMKRWGRQKIRTLGG